MDISDYLIVKSLLIEESLNELIPLEKVPYGELFQAARYALKGPAKRLRPILMLASIEILGGDIQQGLKTASAIEMIHTYSLIHDDLPCMDNDDFRRGNPTTHIIFSEGHAVLTGDFLLTHAFDVIVNDSNLSNEQKVNLITILTKYSGGKGMIGGQVMDLAAEGKKIDINLLNLIHRGKTGALITASLLCGGIIAKASKEHLQTLESFGESIGLAFQIIDDILDVTSSQIKHGKTVSSDITNEKTTYISLLGLEKSIEMGGSLYESALKMLDSLPYDTLLLKKLAEFVIKRTT